MDGVQDPTAGAADAEGDTSAGDTALRAEAAEYVDAERARRIEQAHRLASFGRISWWIGGTLILVAIVVWAAGGFAGSAFGLWLTIGVGVLMVVVGITSAYLASSTSLPSLADSDHPSSAE